MDAEPQEREEGEIKTLPDGSVVIGAPTAAAFAPVSVPGPDDEEVNE
jgi:hypothetical protein